MTIATESWTFDTSSEIKRDRLFSGRERSAFGLVTRITSGRERNYLREMADYLWIRDFHVLAGIDFSNAASWEELSKIYV